MEMAKKLQVQTTRTCRVTKRSQYNFISDQYDKLVKERQEFSKIKSGQGFSEMATKSPLPSNRSRTTASKLLARRSQGA